MPTERIFVENCEVISAQQINGEVPLSKEFPWKSTPVTLTESCPSCGGSVERQFTAVRTRQGKRFLCPKCGRPVQNLYRPPQSIAADWACKECHKLVYSSQYREKSAVSKLAALELLGVGGGE